MSAELLAQAATLAATWLLTWWVHAGAAALLALAAGRLLRRRPADREPVWRLALLLPPLTALAATVAASRSPVAAAPLDVARQLRRLLPALWAPPAVDVNVRVVGGVRVATRHAADAAAEWLAVVVLAVVVACALGAALGLARRHRALSRMVRGRRPVPGAGAELHALRLGGRTVRLTASPGLDSPVALGRDEVCVPPAFLGLPAAQRRAVLAHEVAHLERRDPWWLLAFELLAVLGAAQPLVRRVVGAWRRDAELCCDELAARRTGDARALVASLAALAVPFDAAARDRVPAPAAHDSPLVERAERLLALDLRAVPPRPTRLLPLLGATLLALLALAPALSARGALDAPDPGPGRGAIVDEVSVIRR